MTDADGIFFDNILSEHVKDSNTSAFGLSLPLHLKVVTTTSNEYTSVFGFLEEEVFESLLKVISHEKADEAGKVEYIVEHNIHQFTSLWFSKVYAFG